MREIQKAAEEIGIGPHLSVKEMADSPDFLVTVTYSPKAVQRRIPVGYLMEESLSQVKAILTDMANAARS